MVKRIVIAILVLPIPEIAAFALVAALIGLGWALILMLAATLAGGRRAALRRAPAAHPVPRRGRRRRHDGT